jgi:p-hydroxybenzoate 3-monooxygenase
LKELTGRGISIYGQNEVVKDLTNMRLARAGEIVFEAENVEELQIESKRPTIR